MKVNKKILVYTDGSCLPITTPGRGTGGYAGLIIMSNESHLIQGSYEDTTNNCMELIAVIESIKYLMQMNGVSMDLVTVYTDSTYVMNGAKTWMINWKKNNWKTYDKKDVMNKNLWLQLDELLQQHKIDFQWVRGHSYNDNNNFVDKVARDAATKKIAHCGQLHNKF